MDKLLNIQKTLKLNHGTFNEEKIEQSLCVKYINKNDIVLELGGNIGRVSLIIASIIKKNNLVVFEPCIDTYKKLCENRNLNFLDFCIVNGALSDKELYFHQYKSYTIDDISSLSDNIKQKLQKINVVSFSETEDLLKKKFNTLVIDCEGAFYDILKNNNKILDNIDKIIIENDYQNISHKKYVNELLEKNDFHTVESIDLDPKYFKYHPNTELQKGFYEVKIKKRIVRYFLKDENGNNYAPIIDLTKDTHINFIPKYNAPFIKIKKSNIANAGNGAFTTKFIEKNTFVGIYLGKKQKKVQCSGKLYFSM